MLSIQNISVTMHPTECTPTLTRGLLKRLSGLTSRDEFLQHFLFLHVSIHWLAKSFRKLRFARRDALVIQCRGWKVPTSKVRADPPKGELGLVPPLLSRHLGVTALACLRQRLIVAMKLPVAHRHQTSRSPTRRDRGRGS